MKITCIEHVHLTHLLVRHIGAPFYNWEMKIMNIHLRKWWLMGDLNQELTINTNWWIVHYTGIITGTWSMNCGLSIAMCSIQRWILMWFHGDFHDDSIGFDNGDCYCSFWFNGIEIPWIIYIYPYIGSMYAIYGNIYHQHTPNVSIYTSTMDPMGYIYI
jgi:hypothetical protein